MRLLCLLLLTGCSTTASTTCEPPGTQVAAPSAAGCITVDGGKLLLVKDPAGRWSIPAGNLEAGESSEAAAARETLEEAGVAATPGPPICAVPAKGFVAHACAVSGPSPARADGVETTDARWMSAAEVEALAPTELRFPDQKPLYVVVLRAATRAEQRALSGEPPPVQPAD